MPKFSIDQIDKTQPVLLVEDEAYVATEIEQMLLELGFAEVEVCLTFSAATQRVAEGGFGLAIFDINVGGMLSYGLISETISTGCPVVMISGYFLGTGMADGRVFLAKPIDRKRLAGAIVQPHLALAARRAA